MNSKEKHHYYLQMYRYQCQTIQKHLEETHHRCHRNHHHLHQTIHLHLKGTHQLSPQFHHHLGQDIPVESTRDQIRTDNHRCYLPRHQNPNQTILVHLQGTHRYCLQHRPHLYRCSLQNPMGIHRCYLHIHHHPYQPTQVDRGGMHQTHPCTNHNRNLDFEDRFQFDLLGGLRDHRHQYRDLRYQNNHRSLNLQDGGQ